jgi:hypothetical protein
MRAALMANSVTKRSLLLFSAFHHTALTESGAAVLGAKALTIPQRVARGRTAAPGARSFYDAADIVDSATRHGLQLGTPIDPQLDDLQKVLKGMDKVGSTNIFGKVGKAFAWWDRGLWDFYHNGLKIQAYHEVYMRALAQKRFSGMSPKLIGEAVAEHVNNAFGGQNWKRFWVGKNGQQWGRLLLFAPDWTVSNIKIATDIFANQAKRHFPQIMSAGGRFPISTADLLKADVRATYARQYALRMGIIAGVSWNFANLAMTGWNGGDPDWDKAHFLDGNAKGFTSLIDTGYSNSKSGRKLYLRPAKQAREPFELWESMREGVPFVPGKFLTRKAAPSFTIAKTLITGTDYFGEPIVGAEDGAIVGLSKSMGSILLNTTPIPLQQIIEGQPTLGALLGAMGVPLKNGDAYVAPGGIEAMEELLQHTPYTDQLRKVQERMARQAEKNLP